MFLYHYIFSLVDTMKIEHIHEKGSSNINEDTLLIQDNLFGVFDGATSVDKWQNEQGETGGFLAANIAKEAFAKNDAPLAVLCQRANNAIQKMMEQNNIDLTKKINRWSTSAAIIHLNKESFDWVQIGDSLILVIYNNGSYKLLVTDYDHDEEMMIQWKELADKKIKDIFQQIPGLLSLREAMNVMYGILNGEIEMQKFLNKGTESLKDVQHIILFTDGLFIPKEDPRADDDFDMFVKLFLEGGFTKIRDHIRKMEETDPDCWKYPRYKQYDDIAAISISY